VAAGISLGRGGGALLQGGGASIRGDQIGGVHGEANLGGGAGGWRRWADAVGCGMRCRGSCRSGPSKVDACFVGGGTAACTQGARGGARGEQWRQPG
jgi:hypothetical protein